MDPRALTRATHRMREDVLAGRAPSVAPRSVIEASWRRMRAFGLAPAGAPEITPLAREALLRRRAVSGLEPLLPALRAHLLPTCERSHQIMVVADAEGWVLWREGHAAMRHHADRLGFVGGSAWTESNVGTNAIGTCLVTQEPVHIHAAEHFAESHTRWTCAAAPLRDPLTGHVIGVVDVSGPAPEVHGGMLSLVVLAARVAELELREVHHQRLHDLRVVAAPVLARLGGRALAVSGDGLIAAATGLAVAPERVTLPEGLTPGERWLPQLGQAVLEPLPGGWLVRLRDDEDAAPGDGAAGRVELDLTGARPLLRVRSAGGAFDHRLTPRHAELLLALLHHPQGRSAAQLAADLFGDPARTVTIRAEVSRLRRILGPVVEPQPYRIADGVETALRLPADRTALLPRSSAPVVAALRATAA